LMLAHAVAYSFLHYGFQVLSEWLPARRHPNYFPLYT
jgi:hypothetical protein